MALSVREKLNTLREAIPFVVGVPIAFCLICCGEFRDWVDDVVWKVKTRAGIGR
ncbi:hypothetical protein OIU34_21010 [Pararhizobium sp. BT-229]|uniref:hypothetical protein n=1 Tax=Pararhizobium sp. BT-229 TaxID=2986923 RepID=UPI0021F743CC|nr:hypothetical protein [Pararhizobium sp. BT-229]MCV9964371.1 hypothetical protein [Pararhizobium sp. BT-229]